MALESSEVTTYNLTAVSDPEFRLESNNSVLASSSDYYLTLHQPGMLLASHELISLCLLVDLQVFYVRFYCS